jgi:hypothetical protein
MSWLRVNECLKGSGIITQAHILENYFRLFSKNLEAWAALFSD